MSTWSYATLEIVVDREKIKLSVRDAVQAWTKNWDGRTVVDLKSQDAICQHWVMKLADSMEVDYFSKSVAEIVKSLSQTYGVVYVECFIEGSL